MSTVINIKNHQSHLLHTFAELATLSGNNGHYTDGLCRKINETGKAIEELTVAELLEIHHQHNAWFNKTFS